MDRWRMASAAVGEAGGHPMQLVQVARVDAILIELGVVAGEVEVAVLETRRARSAFSVEEAAERKCDTAGHSC